MPALAQPLWGSITGPGDAPLLPTAAGRPSLDHLPSPLTSFVGRDEALATALRLLRRPDIRLLSLTGPPGIGKTRLGLRVAEVAAGEFRDGVFFVELASVRDPEMLPGVIGGALKMREHAGISL